MGKTLAQMTAEIREVNIEKGWRSPDGGLCAGQTFGDYVALLHSEVSEALEAYRDHRLDDATERVAPPYRPIEHPNGPPAMKPEGVGSELADTLIRLLDMCDVFGLKVFDMDMELADVSPIPLRGETFGDHIAWLHHCAAVLIADSDGNLAGFLRALVSVAERYGINLTAEYERKIAFNRTRAFQHGGRTLADTP